MTSRKPSPMDSRHDQGGDALASEPDDFDDDDGECWNCGGEGFVYGCSWDWQCDTWDGDSCLCTRPCHICHPPKLSPKEAGHDA